MSTAEVEQPGVLLVDDDPAHRSFLERGLRYEGYQVRAAAGGPQALELARQWRPDLILLDVMMPHMDGFEVARALRALGLTAPILFISANDEPETCRRAETAGSGLLRKPLDLDGLLGRIAGAIGRWGG